MSETDDLQRVADAHCEVTWAMVDIDLNPKLDDDMIELLEFKQCCDI